MTFCLPPCLILAEPKFHSEFASIPLATAMTQIDAETTAATLQLVVLMIVRSAEMQSPPFSWVIR